MKDEDKAKSRLKDIKLNDSGEYKRFDGKGYPQGLKDDKIDMGARILAVADSFEAMTNARSYRSAMPFEEAVDEIRRHAGTQFDPEVMEAFLTAVKKIANQGSFR